MEAVSEREIRDDLARRQWDDIDDLNAAIERAISDIQQPQVRSTLPEDTVFRCIVDYIGAYAHWDLPSNELGDRPQDIEAAEDCVTDDGGLPAVDLKNDPPIVDVWK
jgi:hypothetical protein